MKAVPASLSFPTAAPARPRREGWARTWFVPVAVGLSLATHLFLLGMLILLQRQPRDVPRPQNQGTVELLMVEQKGAEASQKGDQSRPAKTARPGPKQAAATPPPPPPKPVQAAPPAAPPPPLAVAGGDEPAPPEQPKLSTPKPQAKPAPEPPAKPDQTAAAQTAAPAPEPAPAAEAPTHGLVFSLNGTDSDTNATALGEGILPASPDDRFRNRPPPYPDDAAMRGEQGDVTVTVHVAANGLAAGADVISSSGSASLDRAAVNAVRKWRFHPAMKDGEPIPFDFTINISFRP